MKDQFTDLMDLGARLDGDYGQTRRADVLQHALDTYLAATLLAHPGSAERARAQYHLRRCLEASDDNDDSPANFAESYVALASDNMLPPDRAQVANALVHQLHERWFATRVPWYVASVIRVIDAILAADLVGPEDRDGLAFVLATALTDSSFVEGDPALLQRAAEIFASLDAEPSETSGSAKFARSETDQPRTPRDDHVAGLASHSEVLWERFSRSGDLTHLTDAVASMRQLVDEAGPAHPRRLLYLQNLADGLLVQAQMTDDPVQETESAEEAVGTARTALDSMGDDARFRPQCLLLGGHASLLLLRLANTRELADQTCALLADAVEALSGTPMQASAYTLYAEALGYRAEIGHGRATDDDHMAAIVAARKAVQLSAGPHQVHIGQGDTNHSEACSAVISALLRRFAARGESRDLVEVLQTIREAAEDSSHSRFHSELFVIANLFHDVPTAFSATGSNKAAQLAMELALMSRDEVLTARLIDIGEKLASAGDGPANAARYLVACAKQLEQRKRFREATIVLEGAVDKFGVAGEPSAQAYHLTTLAQWYLDLRAWDAAIETCSKATDLHGALGDVVEEARSIFLAAGAIAMRGDRVLAVDRYRIGIEICRSGGVADLEARALVSCGLISEEAGDVATALSDLGEAFSVFRTLTDTSGMADVTSIITRIRIRTADLEAASAQVARCVDLCLDTGNWQDARHVLMQHIDTLITGGHGPAASRHEIRLIELTKTHVSPTEAAKTAYTIAVRHSDAGDTVGALNAFDLAHAEYLALDDVKGAANVDYNAAVIYARSGNLDAALVAFHDAATRYIGLGTMQKAADSFLAAAILLAPEHPERARADLDEAEQYARASEANATLFMTALVRAQLDIKDDRADAAAADLARAQELAPGDPLTDGVLHELRSQVAHLNGDPTMETEALDLAVESFRAADASQLTAVALVRLGQALERAGDLDRARQTLAEGTDELLRNPVSAGVGLVRVGKYSIGTDLVVDSRLLIQLAILHGQAGDKRRLLATTRLTFELDNALEHSDLPEVLRIAHAVDEAATAGNLRKAFDLAHAAIERIESAHDPSDAERFLLSTLLTQTSSLARELGLLQAAHDDAASGIAVSAGDDAPHLAAHLLNLGIAARELGRIDEAIDDLERAAGVAARSQNDGWELSASILNSLGVTLKERGRWTEADQAFAEGLALTTDASLRLTRASLLSSRAGLDLARGDLDAAAAGYREAIAINEELGGDHALAGEYANLALVYRERGDNAQARALIERALDMERAAGQLRGVVLDLVALGAMQEDSEAERRYYQEALSIAEEIGFEAGRGLVLSNLGAVEARQGRDDEAFSRLSAAISLAEQTGQPLAMALAFLNRSSAATGLDRLQIALDDAQRAIELAEGLAGAPGIGGQGDAKLQHHALGQLLKVATRLGRGDLAWQYVEQAKAQTLAAQLGYQRWPAPSGVDPAVSAEEQRLLNELRALQTNAVAMKQGFDHSNHRQSLLREQMRTARSALDSLWASMETVAEDYVALRRGATLDASRLAAAVAGDQNATGKIGFLSFHHTDKAITVIAYRAGQHTPTVHQFPIATEELPNLLAYGREVTGLIKLPSGELLKADLHRLTSDMMLGGALETLGEDLEILYLLPHGALNRVPLHMLAPGGRTLIDRWPIAYAPSGSVLGRLFNDREPQPDRLPLVLGYTPDEDERVVFEGEAVDVAQTIGAEPLLGAAAVSGAIQGSWRTVHFSCHGEFNKSDPFGSGLRLADGLLTARQIMSMRIEADLAVLSACDTAHNAASGADDVAGLGHALLHAGVRSALLTLWPVDAGATRILMRGFHANLRTGMGKAAALRQAMLDLRADDRYSDPMFWAPFVLVGRGD